MIYFVCGVTRIFCNDLATAFINERKRYSITFFFFSFTLHIILSLEEPWSNFHTSHKKWDNKISTSMNEETGQERNKFVRCWLIISLHVFKLSTACMQFRPASVRRGEWVSHAKNNARYTRTDAPQSGTCFLAVHEGESCGRTFVWHMRQMIPANDSTCRAGES